MARTYIDTTCKVGQSTPCGQQATWAIAVTEVADNAWTTDSRDGGLVALCDYHAKTPVTEWTTPPAVATEGNGGEGRG